ncbi:hypothetical protein [Ectropis obliqua nucleopolyhedrovirus]|uniref:Uncharacterized protein n=1 Tax=Ectropis obliqua nucleopolyhedrovirus TaxID=59376 RepID=A0EYZ7_9ABAC|nr:hypothetical protein EONV_gp094 [Ectropis obliqua nucleopolyhedrovirus]ABI35777.1 hypothetical protein [Ectropis obliqua nucleopolyhedrovirus]QWV59638.1 hypothetical protein EONV_gp094 [Ectropis obliqua nucleopolyhedrovirus]UYO72891.1 hypothetical protein EONV-gp094 [Ectropis obliqua nucleopolyhedrovirus]
MAMTKQCLSTSDKYLVCLPRNKLDDATHFMAMLRLMCLIISISVCVSTFYIADNKIDYFFYYSHWSFMSAVLMFASSLFTYCVYTEKYIKMVDYGHPIDDNYDENAQCDNGEGDVEIKQQAVSYSYVLRNNAKHMTWYMYVQSYLFNTTISVNLLTSTVFWMIVNITRNDEVVESKMNAMGKCINFYAHSVNFIIVLVELILSAIPVRLTNIYQPLGFTIVYALVYLYYTRLNNIILYSFITNDRELILLALTFAILLCTYYFITYIISFAKYKIYCIVK